MIGRRVQRERTDQRTHHYSIRVVYEAEEHVLLMREMEAENL